MTEQNQRIIEDHIDGRLEYALNMGYDFTQAWKYSTAFDFTTFIDDRHQ